MPGLQILPECYADTALVLQFVPDRQRVVHIFGIPNVAKEMQKEAARENAGLRIGFVDNDKRVPPYLQPFTLIEQENKVLLKRNGQSQQYLVVIDRAIESFLLWKAAEVALDVTQYGFVNDVRPFGKALKTSAIGSNAAYQQLLLDLRTAQAPGFLTIERILNDLLST